MIHERLPDSAVEGWQLVQWDDEYWAKTKPPPSPPRAAEVATDPCWTSLYRDNRIVATWYRHLPMSDHDRRQMAARYQATKALR